MTRPVAASARSQCGSSSESSVRKNNTIKLLGVESWLFFQRGWHGRYIEVTKPSHGTKQAPGSTSKFLSLESICGVRVPDRSSGCPSAATTDTERSLANLGLIA